jgi:hypothetical protein
MITSRTFTTKLPLKINPEDHHSGLNSLFAAAVVSKSFREMLLRDPEQALKQGYLGKGFGLSQADASLIVSLNAKTLPDLAKQVVQTLGQ